jgi:rubrerythrin
MPETHKTIMLDQVFSNLLKMAERLEHASAEFYFEASKHVSDGQVSIKLQSLASKELEHKDFISGLELNFKDKLDRPIGEVAENAISNYVKAFENSKVFDFDYILNQKFMGYESVEAIVDFALTFEKDSIVFYSGLASIVEDETLERLLKEIIREEFNHIADLSGIEYF